MRTSNAMQLKAVIKRKAVEANVPPQLMLQNYLLERLLKRVSISPWRTRIIVKGGVLIGSLVGVENRTTRDLDATITGVTLTHETVTRMFVNVCSINVDDDFTFSLLRTEDIREVDEYPGIRVFLKAEYSPLSVPLSVDVTTGDKITPGAVLYEYPLVFDEGTIEIMAYPLETVLAEKVETVLARGVSNTRLRDFYDVFELWRVRGSECDASVLQSAIRATCEKRGSVSALSDHGRILVQIREDAQLRKLWDAYASRYSYAKGICFEDVCDAVSCVVHVVS